jgi:hypothetical protein
MARHETAATITPSACVLTPAFRSRRAAAQSATKTNSPAKMKMAEVAAGLTNNAQV